MVIVNLPQYGIGISVSQILGLPPFYGVGQYAHKKYGATECFRVDKPYGNWQYASGEYGSVVSYSGIYQKRHGKMGSITVKEKYMVPRNPRTIPQQAQRQKYADSVTAWQDLTVSEKAAYNVLAKGKHMSGYNLFQKRYLLSH